MMMRKNVSPSGSLSQLTNQLLWVEFTPRALQKITQTANPIEIKAYEILTIFNLYVLTLMYLESRWMNKLEHAARKILHTLYGLVIINKIFDFTLFNSI